MIENALISYLGENKPNLISEITAYLTDAGGEFSGVTFATLGRVCELTMIYKTDGKKILKIFRMIYKNFLLLQMVNFRLNHFPINRIVDPHPKLHTE